MFDWVDALLMQAERNIDKSDMSNAEKERLMNELRDPQFMDLMRLKGDPGWATVNSVGDSGAYISDMPDEQLSEIRKSERDARDAAKRNGFDDRLSTPTDLDREHASGGKRLNKVCSKWGKNPASNKEFLEALTLNALSISMENLGVTKTMLGDDCAAQSMRSEALWARNGMPFIQIKDAMWAASLGATSMPPDLAEFIRPPWSSFRISVPPGILSVETDEGTGQPEPCTRLMVMFDADKEWTVVLYGTKRMMHITGESTTGLCEDVDIKKRNVAHDPGFRLTGRDGRVMRIATRLILAVCMSMDNAQRKQAKGRSGKKSKPRRSPDPLFAEYILRPPVQVKVDAREALREYVAGARRGSPKVQSLIRGHWKNQPCGAGRSERKFIHIEPYWRGPEDAPIAVRPHILTGVAK